MSALRLICLSVAVVLTAALLWGAGGMVLQGAGPGEVSAILHPFLIMVMVFCAGFAALVGLIALLWHHRRVRIVLLGIVCTIITIIALGLGAGWIKSTLSDRAFAKKQLAQAELEAAREAAILPIAQRYFAVLISGDLNPAGIANLRPAFDQEVYGLGFKQTEWTHAVAYFQSAHDLYMRLFLNADGRMGALLGIYDGNACLDIEAEYAQGFDATQQELYAELCPAWVVDYAR